ncbi:MAG: tetratricopeptide repeat protein [Bacteroidota bacterium]
MTKILGTALFLTLALGVSAQNGWNWGEDIDKAKEKNVIYTDAYKAKNYAAAVEPLEWLLENTPDLNPSIYQRGVKIYQALAKQETEPVKKEEYIQRGLELHDLRIKYFGKEGDVSVRKAYFAYVFYNKNKEKYPLLYELFSKAFKLEGENMLHGYLVAYMNSVYKYRFGGGELSDSEIIDIYFNITDAIETQKQGASEENRKKMDKSLDTIDRLLLATKVDISCDFVEENLGPKLDQGNDVKIAKKIFKLMIDGECIDRPLALKAAEVIQNDEPTYGVAKFLGAKYAKEENTEEALKYYQQAASLTDDNVQKAEMYVNSARIYSRLGQKSTARNTARRALSFDPSYKDAFELIGDLYFGSYGKGPCYQEKSQVEDRAVFIAAYEQYRKAGASAKMKAAKAQFPSITDIFNESKEEGQSITIGCWINTTVALERRPAN